MFFGTPHFGTSHAAMQQTILNLRGLFSNSNTTLVNRLIPVDEGLAKNHKQYTSISSDITQVCFYEEQKTRVLPGTKLLVRRSNRSNADC